MIRVSGPETASMTGSVCPGVDFNRPWRASIVAVVDAGGTEIEQAVAIPYRAPKSYTGEDMVEIVAHGSPWVVEAVVGAYLEQGARYAEGGEFTRRAVANGKMDLVQAEAVADMIEAETAWQARVAREQLYGALSAEVETLKEGMTALLAHTEGQLDFEENGAAVDAAVLGALHQRCLDQIGRLLDSARAGVRVREGARVVIVGKPNSGKSTLFNTLLAQERAIVTALPGTTRDTLEAEVEIEGLPVVLVDTAGLREAGDPAEEEGVRRARREQERADLVLELVAVDDGGAPAPGDPTAGDRTLVVESKIDVASGPRRHPWGVSALTGEGIAALRREVGRRVAAPMADLEGAVAINQRHERCLLRAKDSIARSESAPLEMSAMEIRSALAALDEIVGVVEDEAVLDAVFSTFCIGK